VDNFLAAEVKTLAPYMSTFDLEKPYNISPNLSMPKPVVASISLMVSSPVDPTELDPAKLAWMRSIAEKA
jgi:hypothetical protein